MKRTARAATRWRRAATGRQAFKVVKESVSKVLAGKNPGALARAEHKEWYGELFQPCVTTGVLRARDLAGYRSNAATNQ